MADKPKGLPPPPSAGSTIVNTLSGLLGKAGIGSQEPVAYSRITQTPIYQTSGLGWPDFQTGQYDPDSASVEIRAPILDNAGVIPHETAHAIYDKAGLAKRPVLQGTPLPSMIAEDIISGHPEMYPPQDKHYDQILANENLAYSIGHSDGTPLVEYVAKRIDPELGQKLLRLHYNALKSKPLPR